MSTTEVDAGDACVACLVGSASVRVIWLVGSGTDRVGWLVVVDLAQAVITRLASSRNRMIFLMLISTSDMSAYFTSEPSN